MSSSVRNQSVRRAGRAPAALAVVALVLGASACGDDDGGDVADLVDADEAMSDADVPQADAENLEEDLEEFGDAVNEAIGAGGGGMLTFDGTEYPIDSVVCSFDGDRVDAGTVGSGYRVLVSGERDDLDLQILGPDQLWFDGGATADGPPDGQATIDGNTIIGEENVWRNNNDDREVMASFVIECP